MGTYGCKRMETIVIPSRASEVALELEDRDDAQREQVKEHITRDHVGTRGKGRVSATIDDLTEAGFDGLDTSLIDVDAVEEEESFVEQDVADKQVATNDVGSDRPWATLEDEPPVLADQQAQKGALAGQPTAPSEPMPRSPSSKRLAEALESISIDETKLVHRVMSAIDGDPARFGVEYKRDTSADFWGRTTPTFRVKARPLSQTANFSSTQLRQRSLRDSTSQLDVTRSSMTEEPPIEAVAPPTEDNYQQTGFTSTATLSKVLPQNQEQTVDEVDCQVSHSALKRERVHHTIKTHEQRAAHAKATRHFLYVATRAVKSKAIQQARRLGNIKQRHVAALRADEQDAFSRRTEQRKKQLQRTITDKDTQKIVLETARLNSVEERRELTRQLLERKAADAKHHTELKEKRAMQLDEVRAQNAVEKLRRIERSHERKRIEGEERIKKHDQVREDAALGQELQAIERKRRLWHHSAQKRPNTIVQRRPTLATIYNSPGINRRSVQRPLSPRRVDKRYWHLLDPSAVQQAQQAELERNWAKVESVVHIEDERLEADPTERVRCPYCRDFVVEGIVHDCRNLPRIRSYAASTGTLRALTDLAPGRNTADPVVFVDPYSSAAAASRRASGPSSFIAATPQPSTRSADPQLGSLPGTTTSPRRVVSPGQRRTLKPSPSSVPRLNVKLEPLT
eukprot:m.6675 g.6675  ORF g.6675 m.6675 type:complete len:683 (-) comp5182_c0_seq1:89-2137(-)